jgi:hypothetical protein
VQVSSRGPEHQLLYCDDDSQTTSYCCTTWRAKPAPSTCLYTRSTGETVFLKGRTAASTREDLEYLHEQYRASPAILRSNVRPLAAGLPLPLLGLPQGLSRCCRLGLPLPHLVQAWWARATLPPPSCMQHAAAAAATVAAAAAAVPFGHRPSCIVDGRRSCALSCSSWLPALECPWNTWKSDGHIM